MPTIELSARNTAAKTRNPDLSTAKCQPSAAKPKACSAVAELGMAITERSDDNCWDSRCFKGGRGFGVQSLGSRVQGRQ